MPPISANLSLPYMAEGQAQKHVTFNEAMEIVDALAQLTVVAFDAETPPASAPDGTVWALGAAPTGAWADAGGQLAIWSNGGWLFVPPRGGWRAVSDGELRVFDGAGWVAPTIELNQIDGLGIQTGYDTTNRLAVAAEATLLTHAGAGHQLKLNKAAAGDTASLLFQTGFSGRAELGTAGSDGFSIKVSPDGSAWSEALVANPASGLVSLPQGLSVAGPVTLAAPLPLGQGGTGGTTAAGARANLGLGNAATATVTASATDATPGRLLRVGDRALGDGWIGRVVPADFSAVDATPEAYFAAANFQIGFYMTCDVGGGPILMPPGAPQFVGVIRGYLVPSNAYEYSYQVFTGFTGNSMWMRRATSATTWTPWALMFHQGNILGTVSQSGGVPTGALIQPGSNANGVVVRLADGTQICTHTLASNSGAAVTWTYPAAFAAAPSVNGSAQATVLSSVCLDTAPGASSVTFSARDSANARRADTCHLTAIGRWF